jgi:DNA-nicking Smr family endonuclease
MRTNYYTQILKKYINRYLQNIKMIIQVQHTANEAAAGQCGVNFLNLSLHK